MQCSPVAGNQGNLDRAIGKAGISWLLQNLRHGFASQITHFQRALYALAVCWFYSRRAAGSSCNSSLCIAANRCSGFGFDLPAQAAVCGRKCGKSFQQHPEIKHRAACQQGNIAPLRNFVHCDSASLTKLSHGIMLMRLDQIDEMVWYERHGF